MILMMMMMMQVAEECRVEAREVTRPVCVTLMDKVVDEKCEDYYPEAECYMESCQNVTRPLATKECHQVIITRMMMMTL